jgi:hypothetical protein
VSVVKQMNVSSTIKSDTPPVRYIAITGSTAKSCKKLKLLLKQTSFYCLVDCYKTSDDLVSKESFYIPDCAIVEVRSVCSIFSVGKKIDSLKDVFPGIKVLLYYNMLRRYPLLEQKHGQYPSLHLRDDEQKQLLHLDHVLKQEQ